MTGIRHEEGAAADGGVTAFQAHRTRIGDLEIRRALPTRGRRMVGPWCFLDRFGPLSFTSGQPLDVGLHPHIGIQTVSWLLQGEVVHHDSLGNEALMRAGGVNVMTSGGAIAHAENTPTENTGRLNGVQLWTALPDRERHRTASFEHIREVPTLILPGGSVRVFSGEMETCRSSAVHFSDLIGADLEVHPAEAIEVPLMGLREHALMLLDGDLTFEGRRLESDVLYYLSPGRHSAELRSDTGARVLLLGGEPFEETILMWWNFVARTPDEIRAAREDWQTDRRFGGIPGYEGPRIPAPELLRLAAPTPLS